MVLKKNYYNYPTKLDESHYEEIRKDIIKYFSDNKDIMSIYEYGSVSAPGVSDLDLIFVLNDLLSPKNTTFDLSSISDSAHSLVADGTIIKMPKEVLINILF